MSQKILKMLGEGGLTLLLAALSTPAASLDINGVGERSGIQALYLFRETSGLVLDVSGNPTPINMSIDNSAAVLRQPGMLEFETPAIAKSTADATSLVSACKASNAITIEAWLLNQLEEPARPKPVRIISLGHKKADGSGHEEDFFLGQDYDAAAQYSVGLNIDGTMKVLESPAIKGKVFFSGLGKGAQHVVFTRDASGVSKLYVSDDTGVLLQASSAINAGSFSSWADNMTLSFGNLSNWSDFPEYVPGTQDFNPERKSWTGSLNMVAIYCRALSATELIGSGAPGSTPLPIYKIPDPNAPITEARKRAQLIYRRITGINTPIDNPILATMEQYLATGTPADAVAAARIATQEDGFLNITVRDMAARMSTRDQTVNTPLNDMVATIIGVARDGTSAKELLTGNFLYRAKASAAVPRDEIKDFLTSNNHYQALEDGRFNLAKVLERVDGQKLYNGATRSVVLNPDPAGVITSRAFMAAHAIAGTNRRAVEFTFRNFLCIPINQWADPQGTDTYVGRDVDRAPGGDHNKYKTTCRACHSVMDSFRGAFSKVDFSANYVKHGDVMFGLTPPNANAADQPEFMAQDPMGIASKMNRNADTFKGGNPVEGTEWLNNANLGTNATYFGWPAANAGDATNRGNGIKGFAALVADAKAFPRCMAMRAFRSACKRDPSFTKDLDETAMVDTVAKAFVDSNYNIRELFSNVVVRSECIGN